MSNESSHFGSGFVVGALTIGALGAVAVLLIGTQRVEKITKRAVATYHDMEDAAEILLHKPKKRTKKTTVKNA